MPSHTSKIVLGLVVKRDQEAKKLYGMRAISVMRMRAPTNAW